MGTVLQMYNMCQHQVYKNKAVSKIKKRSREVNKHLFQKGEDQGFPRNLHQILAGYGSPPVALDLGVNDRDSTEQAGW